MGSISLCDNRTRYVYNVGYLTVLVLFTNTAFTTQRYKSDSMFNVFYK